MEGMKERYRLAYNFECYGGERAEEIEIKEEEEHRCKREFFKHNHDLTKMAIVHKSHKNYARCHNCNYHVIDQPILGCLQCKIYLHQNCATKGMQLNIRHIFHPFHRLTLKSYDSDDSLTRCNACKKKVNAGKFMFDCKSCSFHLCVQCSLLKPNIKDTVSRHHHLFTFFSYTSHNFVSEYCIVCGGQCDEDDLIVRCVNCNFNIHLRCFPTLPRTIKHQCHIDPLNLITDPNLVASDKGYDEFYCDACEKQRDRTHPVYCSNECLFVAHFKCVLSEVLFSITLPESDLEVATAAMFEQSNIQDDHYFGDIISDKAEEREIIEKLKTKEEIKNPEMIQPVEYYLANLIGDEVMAREFLTKLITEENNKENGERKNKTMELVVLNEKIVELLEGIAKQTKILKDFNEELEKVEARHAELLRLQH